MNRSRKMQSFLSELKERLSELMKDAGCRPQMTIRRAGREEYLLAAPVFLRESRQTAEALIQRVQQDGWEVAEENGWLLLSKELTPPQSRMIHPAGECACVCSLLKRHPSNEKNRVMTYGLLKAADENAMTLEIYCEKLHRDLAAMLREEKALPDLYGFLNDAVWRFEQC